MGSSGTITIFPLFGVPSSSTSTVSSFSLIVLLFFYQSASYPIPCRKEIKRTYHDLFSVIWTHPFLSRIGHDGKWWIQTIEMP
jgi:hypothetical protein